MIRRILLAKNLFDTLSHVSPMVILQAAKDDTKLLRKRTWYRFRIFLKYYFHRSEKEPVFVVAKRRSGSNLCLSYLNSAPSLNFYPPEPLNPQMYYGIREENISKKTVLNHLAYTLNDNPKKICGFKMLFIRLLKHRLTLDDIRGRFPGAKFLILYRRSLLEQFVSLKIAEATDRWQWSRDFVLPETLKVDPAEFKEFCVETRQFYEKILQFPWIRTCAQVIGYEDLAADPQRVFDTKVFPFLGVPSFPVSTTMVKQNTRPLEALVENFEQVRRLAKDFDFEAFWPGVDRVAGVCMDLESNRSFPSNS